MENTIEESAPTSLVFHARNAEMFVATVRGVRRGWDGTSSAWEGMGGLGEGTWSEWMSVKNKKRDTTYIEDEGQCKSSEKYAKVEG